MHDDLTLLHAWQTGDERAGQTLVEGHYDAVARFFATKARDSAPDLIQRTFLKFIESRARMAADSNVRAYILGIARHVLMDHYRSSYKGNHPLDFAAMSIADLQPTPSTMLADQRQARLLLLALRQLPLDSQILLELYFWEELPARAVAEVLQVPEGTVRTRLRRARQLLEQGLARLASSPDDLHSTLANLDAWAAQIRQALA